MSPKPQPPSHAPKPHLLIDWPEEAGRNLSCAVSAWSRYRFARFGTDQTRTTYSSCCPNADLGCVRRITCLGHALAGVHRGVEGLQHSALLLVHGLGPSLQGFAIPTRGGIT